MLTDGFKVRKPEDPVSAKENHEMGWQKIRESFSAKQIKQRVSVVARKTKISVLDAPIRTEFEPDILARLPKLT